ncbi:MAG: hypothetical protein M5U28_16210 [Sandaracinaceae bacterium]|nr:hypothetical protein [Sandaracinaceae bacterium]
MSAPSRPCVSITPSWQVTTPPNDQRFPCAMRCRCSAWCSAITPAMARAASREREHPLLGGGRAGRLVDVVDATRPELLRLGPDLDVPRPSLHHPSRHRRHLPCDDAGDGSTSA